MRELLAVVFIVFSMAPASGQASDDPIEVRVYNVCILAYFHQCEHGGKATNAPAAVIKACLSTKRDKLSLQCRDALDAMGDKP